MELIDLVGFAAQILFISSAAAQAWRSWLDGHSDGISHGWILMLIIGLGSMIMYVVSKIGFDLVLLLGYTGQMFFVLVVASYKYWPRRGIKLPYRRYGEK